MAVAEKYRVERDFKFNGRSYSRGDSIDRATIVGVLPEKLGSLQRTRFISLDPVTRPLDKMSKSDLVDYGREVGASVTQSMTKPVLIETIEGEL